MSVTAAHGFVASGVHCGIRKTRSDLALIRSTAPATGAGMFTVNRMLADAPWARDRLASHAGRAFMLRVGPLTQGLRIDERGLLHDAPLRCAKRSRHDSHLARSRVAV